MQSLRLQPTCSPMSLQHGAVQAVGPSIRRRLPEVPALHRWSALPLLPRGLLQGPHQADHPSQSMQTLRLPPDRGIREDVQPANRSMSLQRRRGRHHLQPLCQGIPTEPIAYRSMHQNPDSADDGDRRGRRRIRRRIRLALAGR
ncbi:unnamed protein product [Callosobruchus maculatus]|uniref:Uncharacterized protein n=1 Tax=Callosobruchus maculatus TaxID=64391 RepID=A0A653DKG4_CALMS|nr:unnamed protein product [Callosobruchus maculatus]